MYRLMIVSIAVIAAAACSTTGPERQPAPEVATAVTASALDQLAAADADGTADLVCYPSRVTGSRRPVQVCATRAQFEERRRAGRDVSQQVAHRAFWEEGSNDPEGVFNQLRVD